MKLTGLAFYVTAALAGCTSGGDSSGGDDVPDGEAPPFTDGVSTLTGRAEPGLVDGPRGTAQFNNPTNVFYKDGNLYVADFDNNKVRLVDAETGETETLIDQENFRRPFGFALAPNGTLYVSTDDNSTGGHDGRSGTIWKVSGSSATVVAENIGRARSMVVLSDGRIVYTDYQAHVIQIFNPANNENTVLAGSLGQAAYADGTGPSARFNGPYGLVLRDDGKLLVADQLNNKLRVVALDGTVTTLGGGSAGFADGAVAGAQFSMPQGMVQSSSGDVYITDLGNYRVRRLSGGTVDTIAGSGSAGYLDSDDKLSAELYGLEGVAVTPDGSMVFLADGGRGESVPYNRIRSVKM